MTLKTTSKLQHYKHRRWLLDYFSVAKWEFMFAKFNSNIRLKTEKTIKNQSNRPRQAKIATPKQFLTHFPQTCSAAPSHRIYGIFIFKISVSPGNPFLNDFVRFHGVIRRRKACSTRAFPVLSSLLCT